jgi:hypothetical protein
VRPDEVRWVPLGSPLLAGALRVDDPGTVRLYLSGDEGVCTTRFSDGTTWRVQETGGVHKLLWTGADAPLDLPEVAGCRARVRVTGLEGEVPETWVAGRWVFADAHQPVGWKVVDPEPVLWFTHPAGQPTPYRVQVTHPSGTVTSWVVTPRPSPSDRWTGTGDPWQTPLALPLEPGDGQARLLSTIPLAAKITAYRPPELASPEEPVTPERAAGDLRQHTRVIAAAGHDLERADALLRRAHLLHALGAPHLAWQDYERALALVPQVVEENPVSSQLQRESARLWAGAGHWVPAGPGWVSEDAPEGALEHATAGDYLQVAELVRTTGDPRVWWRRAVSEGQVLTAEQRITAHRDLVAHTPREDRAHPWLWPLRVLSRWERVNQVRGPPGPFDLFPDSWPDEEIVRVSEGWDFQLPAGDGGGVPVRCRSTRVEPPAPTCRFRALGLDGAELARVEADTWGTPAIIELPPSRTAVHLTVDPGQGVEAQLRLPGQVPPPPPRSAWSIAAGRTAHFEVFGPTVVRLQTWTPEGPGNELSVAIQSGEGTSQQRYPLQTRTDLLIPVHAPGAVTVSVQADRAWRLAPDLRVPRATSRPALGDAALMATARRLQTEREALAASEAPEPWTPPTGRPPLDGSATVVTRTKVGNADVVEVDPEDRSALGLRFSQTLAITQRLRRHPLWLLGQLRGDVMPGGNLVSAAGTFEGRVLSHAWRLWLLASTEWVNRVDEPTSFSALHLRVRITADGHLGPRWQLVGRLNAVQRIPIGGWDPADWAPDLVHLWSPYKDTHTRTLEPRVELRWAPGPWTRVVGWTEVSTNERLSDALDHATAVAQVELARPGVWLVLGGELDLRLADDDREFAYLAPELFAHAMVTTWPGRDLAVQIRPGARYRVRYQEATALIEVSLIGSRDRALRDFLPSRLSARHAHEWYQDNAAERRRLQAEEDHDLATGDP